MFDPQYEYNNNNYYYCYNNNTTVLSATQVSNKMAEIRSRGDIPHRLPSAVERVAENAAAALRGAMQWSW